MQLLRSFLLLCVISILGACAATKPVKVAYSDESLPSPPDYSDPFYWSALPDKEDFADHVPSRSSIALMNGEDSARADVFYLYPTLFFSRKQWNADLHNEKLNKFIDEKAVQNQATVFNGSCRIFIPRYRQATFQSYFSMADPDALRAFALAYTDVKAAFEYYLEHYNNGRPIIIAGHSQGTTHAVQLLKDYFDGKPMQQKLVAAYLIGMPVYKNELQYIPPSDSAGQIGCYISWRSYITGHYPREKYRSKDPDSIVVINPLTFSRIDTLIANTCNAGGLNRDANTIIPNVCNAQIHNDIIWVSKPDVPGKALLFIKNMHPADYNLYWMNIRNNVQQQIDAYYRQYGS